MTRIGIHELSPITHGELPTSALFYINLFKLVNFEPVQTCSQCSQSIYQQADSWPSNEYHLVDSPHVTTNMFIWTPTQPPTSWTHMGTPTLTPISSPVKTCSFGEPLTIPLRQVQTCIPISIGLNWKAFWNLWIHHNYTELHKLWNKLTIAPNLTQTDHLNSNSNIVFYFSCFQI